MNINIVSEAVLDESSDPANQRWFATVKIKSLKKGYEEIEVWRGDLTCHSIEEAEEVGYERVAIGFFPILK